MENEQVNLDVAAMDVAALRDAISERETTLTDMAVLPEAEQDADVAFKADDELKELTDELGRKQRLQSILGARQRAEAAEEELSGEVALTPFADVASQLIEVTGAGTREGEVQFDVNDLMGSLLADDITRPAGFPTGAVPSVASEETGRPVGLVDIVPMLPTTAQTIQLPHLGYSAGADVKGEGDAAGENTGTLSLITVTTQRVPVYMKASIQSLRDTGGLQGDIRTTLLADARQKVDRMIMGRTSSDQEFGVSNTIWGASGVQYKSSADAAGDKVAELFQELLNAAGDYGFDPNYVVMARKAWGGLVAATKDTDNDSIFDGRGRRFDGVPVVYTTSLDSSKKMMFGGVFNARSIQTRIRANPTIRVTEVNDDALKGMRTVILEMEIACAVRGAPMLAGYKDAASATDWV